MFFLLWVVLRGLGLIFIKFVSFLIVVLLLGGYLLILLFLVIVLV